MIEIMRETKVTISKNISLDWLYKQKKEVSVEELKEFIETNKKIERNLRKRQSPLKLQIKIPIFRILRAYQGCNFIFITRT